MARLQTCLQRPANRLSAQQLRLNLDARSALEKMITGSIWFDDLSLKRSAVASPASGSQPSSP